MALPSWDATKEVPAPQGQDTGLPSWDSTHDLEERYGGISGGLKAAALGAGSTASFGTLDEFLTHSGLMKPEDIKGYKETNPISTGVGEVGGVLGALALPETGLLGAASAPVKAVSGLGGAVSKAVGAALPEAAGAVGQIASKAASLGLGSAIEGAAYGLGKSVSEHALGDPELNGEKIASNIGTGFLFGGSLGSALGAAEVAIPHVVSSAKDALSKLYDVSVGLPGKEPGVLGKAYAQSSSFVSGKPYEQIVDAMQDRVRSLTNPEEQKEVIGQFSEGLKDQHSKVNKALSEANRSARLQETASYLKEVPGEAALPEMVKTVDAMKSTIQEMRSEPDLYPGAYPRILEQVVDRASKEVGSESSAFDVFKSLNDLKGRLDEEIDYGLAPSGGDLRAQNKIGDIRRAIKTTLEEPSIWGEAAARQAEFNDAQSQFFNLTGKKGLFRQSFMGPALGKGGKLTYEVSPAKVETYLKQINSLRGEAKTQALKQYLETSDNLVNQIEKTYQSLPEKGFDRSSIQSVIDKNKVISQKAFDQAEFSKTLNSLGAGAHNVPLFEGAAGATAILGHPVVGAAMETANLLKAPGLGIQRLAKVERLVQSAARSINSGVSAIFKAGAKLAEPLVGFGGSKMSPQEKDKKYKKVTSQINDIGNDPNKMMSALERSTANLHPYAPQISQGLQMTMARATSFLQSKIPTNGIEQKPLSAPYQPSNSELSKWHKYYSIVEDPTHALHQVASGTLVPETMETLASVYPKLLANMQTAVMNKMTDVMGKGSPIPYRTKLSLSMFLGNDLVNSLDPKSMLANQNTLSTATQAKAAQTQAQMGSANQKNVGKMKTSNRLLTSAQRSAERQET